ncbi:hypothetical protein KCP69_01055 [Salmonella enterica subsp. enterica]|nr:hypothetical protein KCP69_01055 [Salmonella enterica subsp. enterica]
MTMRGPAISSRRPQLKPAHQLNNVSTCCWRSRRTIEETGLGGTCRQQTTVSRNAISA